MANFNSKIINLVFFFAPMVPYSGIACAESCLHRAVLRESWEARLKRPLSKLIVDLFLQLVSSAGSCGRARGECG